MQVEELLKPFPIKEFHPFPRALMGPGAHELIGPEAKKLGFRRTLVMTTGLRGSDTVHKIVESMKYHGLEVVVYDKVESNPKDYNVMDAVALYQENKCDSFVSIGGGSITSQWIDESRPVTTEPQGWTVTMTASVSDDWRVDAYAVCATIVE